MCSPLEIPHSVSQSEKVNKDKKVRRDRAASALLRAALMMISQLADKIPLCMWLGRWGWDVGWWVDE